MAHVLQGGRPSSSTPEESVDKIAASLGVSVPGDEAARNNRIAGLGPLLGIAAGVSTGSALGVARALGWLPTRVVTGAVASAVGMVAGNGPMTLLGVTDPRSWAASDWAADVIPHLAYGVVAAAVLDVLNGDGPHR